MGRSMGKSTPGRASTGLVAGVVSVICATSWWVVLAAAFLFSEPAASAYEEPNGLVSSALSLLPLVAGITGFSAIRTSKPAMATIARDPRQRLGQSLGWTGLLAGGIAPFFVIAAAMDQGM